MSETGQAPGEQKYLTYSTGALNKAVEIAVFAERERCAKIAEEITECNCERCRGGALIKARIAAKIRSGQ